MCIRDSPQACPFHAPSSHCSTTSWPSNASPRPCHPLTAPHRVRPAAAAPEEAPGSLQLYTHGPEGARGRIVPAACPLHTTASHHNQTAPQTSPSHSALATNHLTTACHSSLIVPHSFADLQQHLSHLCCPLWAPAWHGSSVSQIMSSKKNTVGARQTLATDDQPDTECSTRPRT